MRKAMILAILLALVAAQSFADDAKDPKAETYSVMQLNVGKEVSWSVVPVSEIKNWTKRQEDEHKAELEAWEKARKEAKGKSASPKPEKPKIKRLKTFKTEAEARAHMEELKAKQEKEKAKKKSP